jgi:regulatory protein
MTMKTKTSRNSAPSISDAAWRLLSMRSRSRRELQLRLCRRGFEAEDVERELDRLQDLGYIDDDAFARSWVSARQSSSSPRSSRALNAELRLKGVGIEVVRAAIAEVDDLEAALVAAQKPASRLRNLPYPEFCRRLYAHLQRRGFGYETAKQATEAAWRDLEWNPNEQRSFT